ncbi:MAG TPA: hypothetical protein VKK30_01710, partial [Actinomycetota bacterium]|nr:hypothetical protein [Actinomycetota bacterium]
MRPSARLGVALCAAAVVASACGQYPNVHQRALTEAQGAVSPGATGPAAASGGGTDVSGLGGGGGVSGGGSGGVGGGRV